jgi:hypothetical protein
MGPAAVSTVRVAGRRTAASSRTGPGPAAGTSRLSTRVQPGPPSTPPREQQAVRRHPDSPCRPPRCCAGVSDYRSGFEGVPDRMLRSLRIRDASVELCDLALGQMTQLDVRSARRRAADRSPQAVKPASWQSRISTTRPALHSTYGELAQGTVAGSPRMHRSTTGQHDARARGQAHVRHGRQQAAVRHFTEGDIATHAPHGQTGAPAPLADHTQQRPRRPGNGAAGPRATDDGRHSWPPADVLDGMAAPHPIARTRYVLTSAERLSPGPSAALSTL